VRCNSVALTRTPLLFGFNAYITPTTVRYQRAVGANVTRLIVPWSQVEPQPGQWNWSTVDQQYGEIIRGGLRPLLVVFGPPCWAEAQCNVAFASPPMRSADGSWSAYVRALTARYPDAVGVEVWNEPNLASAFYPQADPKRFTQLLSEAYRAVKSVNPSMPVISGGVAMNDATGAGSVGYASRTFLEGMYAAGARRWMDGLAIHVYPSDTTNTGSLVWNPGALSRWLAQVRAVGHAADAPDVPIWITEMGVSTTTEPGFPAAVSPEVQASDLMTMLQTARGDPAVRAVLIDTLQDAAPDVVQDLVSDLLGPLINYDVFYNQVIEGLGVFHTDWTPKPAACQISKAFSGSLSC
jgi:hypothetical protein